MRSKLSRVAFEILDTDRDGLLSLLDLFKFAANISDYSELGQEINLLIREYKIKNVDPKYIKKEMQINFICF